MTQLALALALALGTTTQVSFAPGSRVKVEGDSNAHPWSCETTAARVSSSRAALPAPPGLPLVEQLRVVIPVERLGCGNGTMEEKLRDALKAKEFPAIEFVLASMQPVEAGGSLQKVSGELTIAGRTRPVSFELKTSPDGTDALAASANVPLRMSDFGVDPPSALLGMLKTYDAVLVKIELKVRLAALTD